MTPNLFTNSNQLTDSLKIGAKSFVFINIKRGKGRKAAMGLKGG